MVFDINANWITFEGGRMAIKLYHNISNQIEKRSLDTVCSRGEREENRLFSFSRTITGLTGVCMPIKWSSDKSVVKTHFNLNGQNSTLASSMVV